MVRFRIRTNWTNSVSQTHEFALEDLADAATRDRLMWAFADPERLRPGETRQALTERAAASFASVAQSLRERGHDPQAVAHFVYRLVFSMFADDVGLLPGHVHADAAACASGSGAVPGARRRALPGDGVGRPGRLRDGGLVQRRTVRRRRYAAAGAVGHRDGAGSVGPRDWSEIDPSILGTLFERGLDPGKRAQLGAHYTDREKILQLVEPVVVRPLLAVWDREKTAVAAELERAEAARSRRADEAAQRRRASVPDVPDPAAGVHGTRSRVRLGELPLPGAAGAQGPRASGADRGGGGPRVPAHVPGGRPGERQGHRDQPLRGGAGAGVGLGRRDPVDAAQRLRGGAQPDPEAARHDRGAATRS